MRCHKCGYDWSNSGDSAHVCGSVKVKQQEQSAQHVSTECVGEPVAWINEDELPESYPYDAMFPYSKVDMVRMFPVFEPQLKHDDGRTDALRDLSYCAGLKAGWNFCVANDHIGFEQAQNCMSEALKVLKHTTPQQRPSRSDMTWVGLTDEDKQQLATNHPYGSWEELCSTIEAKVKEKNT